MEGWRVELLGPPRLVGPAGPLELPRSKAAALLWLLAGEAGRTLPRPRLAGLLYEERPDPEARRLLTGALKRLRAWLPVWPIRTAGDGIAWDADAGVALDTIEFERLTARPGDPAALRRALALWRGPFLDGVEPASDGHDDWLRATRQVWEQRRLDGLERLVGLAEAAGDAREALEQARRGLALDPARERLHRAAMHAAYQLGDRAAALEHYRLAESSLARLGATPTPDLLALKQAIQSATPPPTPSASLTPPASPVPRASPVPPASPAPRAPRASSVPPASPGPAPSVPPGSPVPALPVPPAPPARPIAERSLPVPVRGPGGEAPEKPFQGGRVGTEHSPIHPLPLVGRDTAIQTLRSSLIPGSFVLLEGDPGIGKTRLVEALLEETDLGTSLLGECDEGTATLPYAPFVRALQRALGPLDLDALDLPEVWLVELARLLPDLQARRPDLLPRASVDAELRRQRLYQSVARFLAALPSPTLLVLEDLHWLDDASRLLLGSLLRDPELADLRVLATLRTGEAAPEVASLLADLRRRARLTRVELGPLDPAATAELVARATGRSDPTLAGRLHAETSGNPLYLIHLLRAGTTDPAGQRAAVPAAIAELVAGRLARLGPAPADLAAATAICAGGAPFELARRVADLPTADALTALDALLAAGILREDAPSGLTFSHDLVRRAVDGTMSRARRTILHARAFDLLLDGGPGLDREPVRLAYHAAQAQLWEPAVHWSQIAAQAADEVMAGHEAAELLLQALDGLTHLPATAERRRLAVELRLRMVRGTVATPLPVRQAALVAAEADARALADDALRTSVLVERMTHLYVCGYVREGVLVGEELLVAARARGDAGFLARVLRGVGGLTSLAGDLDRTVALLDEGVRLGEAVADYDAMLSALSNLLIVHGTRGELGRAQELFERLVRLTASLSSPVISAFVDGTASRFRLTQSRWREAEELARRGEATARETGHQMLELLAAFTIGPARLGMGDFGGAVDELEQTIERTRQCGSRVLLDRLYAYLAEARLWCGDRLAAALALAEARRIADEEQARFGLALCARVDGMLAAVDGDLVAARASMAESVRGFGTMGARLEVARSQQQLAALLDDGFERRELRRRVALLMRDLDVDELSIGIGAPLAPVLARAGARG